MASTSDKLTGREREVLDLLGEGESTTQIAHGLFITPNTVRNHITSILTKTRTHTRLQAVAAGRRGHVDRGAAVLAWCESQGWHLTVLQRTLLVQAFLTSESGCDGAAHQWPPRVDGEPWRCLCGAVTVDAP